jgi:hypothetical protein
VSAFCRSDPSVRFVSFEIFVTGVFAFEWARNSFSSAFVYSRATRFFAFLATYCSLICEAALLPQIFSVASFVRFQSHTPLSRVHWEKSPDFYNSWYVGTMPTLALEEMLQQVIVNCVAALIALVATEPCTPSTGLTVALKPLVPMIEHDAGGLATG